jgi:hypothetical protein
MTSVMYDEKRESARERAARIWHNGYILRNQKYDEPQIVDQCQSTVKREIMKLLKTKDDEIVHKYKIVINLRLIMLLREKLRRLKESQNE